jgi:phosphoadenosine phosphosulfate reductase
MIGPLHTIDVSYRTGGGTVAEEAIDLERLRITFEEAYPQDILRWASDLYGSRLAVVTSFGPTGIVTLHMLSQIAPETSILTLDTGLLFRETYELMDELQERLGLTITSVRPEFTVEEQGARFGDALWEREPDKCCFMRKTVPLGKALDGYAAWIAGVRRDQSPQRAQTPIIAWDVRYNLLKINPLATWTEDMVWGYIRAHELPYNRLHDQGYPSIGCHTCTRAVAAEGYSRKGRWGQSGKTECGIHLATTES